MQTLRSIQRSLDLVEKRLVESVSIDELARHAGMSLWHFQRTFTALVGEPVGRYLRRRRIAEAAKRLFEFEGTLLDLALEYQFESHEAFTRAFKAELSVTPSEWREAGGKIRDLRRPEYLSQEKLNQRYMKMSIQPEIVSLSPAVFIGFEGRFISAQSEEANNLTVIPKLWDAYFDRLAEIPSCDPGVSYGLAQDPEALGQTREHPDEFLYLAAAKADEGAKTDQSTKVPEGMARWESPSGLFAKFEHRGPTTKIGDTMAYIYGKWMPANAYQSAEGPDFQRIDDRFIPNSEDSVLDIFIPIK